MFLSIDLGGSTIDILGFDHSLKFYPYASLESTETDKSDLQGIIRKAGVDLRKIEKIVLTGGYSRIFGSDLKGISVTVVYEIEAIGRGGLFLAKKENALVCSLGTGTCCVSANQTDFRHVGGTGVGGGSFVGLCRTLLKIEDFYEIKKLVAMGNTENVDISVAEIVGGGIGLVPGNATAANFAKANSNSKKADLAKGIANLVGQTIASIAVFAARAENHSSIILGGKLIRLPEIITAAQKTAAIYDREVIVPPHAEFLSAIGAGVRMLESEK